MYSEMGLMLTIMIAVQVIRNSWSAKYGAAGYVLFQRGANLCGVERDLATVNVV